MRNELDGVVESFRANETLLLGEQNLEMRFKKWNVIL